jgi:hypothetical protein
MGPRRLAERDAWARGQGLLPPSSPEPEGPPENLTLFWRLRGVVFEDVPGKRDAVTGEPLGNSMLHAYADGERFSIEARPAREKERDIDAALALLNQVLQARGSSTRFAIVEYGGPNVAVVSGPGPALQRAHALDLWRLSEVRTAVATRTLADVLVEGMLGKRPPELP